MAGIDHLSVVKSASFLLKPVTDALGFDNYAAKENRQGR
jgi:hypothetical protein